MTDIAVKPEVNPAIQTIKEVLRSELDAAFAERYEEQRRKADEEVVRKNVPSQVQAEQSIVPAPQGSKKGLGFARYVKYLYQAGGDPFRALEVAKRAGDAAVTKALGESTLSGGGAAVPTEFASEMIEELGARSVVLKQAVQTLPMKGSLVLPYIDTSATASWVGENSNVTSSQPAFGQIQLRDHLLSVVVPASNTFLKNASANADVMLRDHMLRVAKRTLDSTLIRGVGASNEPAGLAGLCYASNTFSANATVNLANVTADLTEALYNVMNGNIDLDDGCAWLISPRTWSYLMGLRGAQDYYAFRDEMARGSLLGFKFDYTTNIPDNLTGTTNASEVYFAHFPTMVFALGEDFRVEMFRGGAYYNGSAVQSGVAQDQTVFQLVLSCDFASQYRGKNISVIDTVKWGA
jgi:HK97 family phage major capsid protein